MPFSTTERQRLLEIAYRALRTRVLEGSIASSEADAIEFPQTAGAFVSLYDLSSERPKLRGCIGTFISEQPLAKTITEMAAAAATRDPRFSPVEASELDALRIELSVLSVPQAIDPACVKVGLHGLLVTRGDQRGVLLPPSGH